MFTGTHRIRVSQLHDLAPVVAPTKASSVTNSRSVTSTVYWASWVCFGVWGFRFDTYDIVSGWWIVLGVFWFSAGSVHPAYLLADRFRLLRIALGVTAAGMLIYGTDSWFEDILGGWAIVRPGHWLQLTSLPLRALGASILTAIAIVPLFRRALGPSTPWLLAFAALLPGLVEFGRAISPVSGVHHHGISYAIELFDVCILPLIIAAVDHRLSLLRPPHWIPKSGLMRLWKGDVSLNVAFLWIYSPIICLYLVESAIERQFSSGTYSFWEHDTVVNGARITYLLILVVGSLISWRSINRFAPILGHQIRRLYAIVIIVSVTLAWQTAGSYWFGIGRVLTNSTKAALGSAYQFRLLYPGNDLLLSGDITYGLADRLAEQLAAHPDVHRVWLRSDGGMIGEGSAAAKIIAAHNVETIVGDDECSSACTILFLAGRTRVLEAHGRLGFHAGRDFQPPVTVNHAFRAAYASFDVDQGFVARVEAVKPPGLWYPTRDELIAARVLPASGRPRD